MTSTDVMILGGGPAGASAALALLSFTDLKVMLVDSSDFCRQRVGEHVSGSLFSLLEYLGLEPDDFGEDCFMPTYGNISYWGQDLPNHANTIQTAEGPTYQLNRELFDLKLLETVSERGGLIFPRTRGTDFRPVPDGSWELDLRHPDQGDFRVRSRYLIDASGRSASLSRRLRATVETYDRLMGVGCFFRLRHHDELPWEQWIEATSDGWWYMARLPDQMVTLTFFTDADLVSQNGLQKPEIWLDLLRQSRHVQYRLNGGALISREPWVRNACSQITDVSKVPNFIAVGDAAVAFDPISSLGIGSALSSACSGARVAHEELMDSSTEARRLFQANLSATFGQYLETRSAVYRSEERWLESAFWARRRGL